MGVPKFYRWISERYPCLSEVVKENQIPEFDNLYLDMNGIIHACSHPNDEDPHFRITEEQIFKDIFHYIEVLFRIIRPKKTFFMAVDGVAPRAKMNQQRGRRFKSAKEAETLEEQAKSRGEVLPAEAKFDSNCITPGTPFMTRLHDQLQYFVTAKVTHDEMWRGIRIFLSGHNCPGEGEHKIMDFIRFERSQKDYDVNTRHCLYGLDADLIMLGLCSHEPHFSLLREEVKFNRPQRNKEKGPKQQRICDPEQTTFHLLHLSILREYLEMEFSDLKDCSEVDFDLEKIIDDWVFMGFLVGNDFVPHLPNLHIHDDALPLLYDTYKTVLPSLGGYINECGYLNLPRFEKFLQKLSDVSDKEWFLNEIGDIRWLDGKRLDKDSPLESIEERANRFEVFQLDDDVEDNDMHSLQVDEEPMLTASQALEKGLIGKGDISDEDDAMDLQEFEPESGWSPEVARLFREHRFDYYRQKMHLKIDKHSLRDLALGYVKAIQWILHYYYHGCQSWSWYYPLHYAPFITDVCNFSDLHLQYEMSEPFLPFQQLMGVLPAASGKLLPLCLRELMTDPLSPVLHYYPTDFETDLNGKKNDWEAVVCIPFINEQDLLTAMQPKMEKLSKDEKSRNSHGPHLLFTTSDQALGTYHSGSDGFTDIHNHRAICQPIGREDMLTDGDDVTNGLLEGVKLDVYFPGFPTTKHLKYKTDIQNADCRIFQAPSRKPSMIMKILNQSKDIIDDAVIENLINKEVYYNWPHMNLCKVMSISNRVNRFYSKLESSNENKGAGNDLRVSQKKMTAGEIREFDQQAQDIIYKKKQRWGIELDRVNIIAYVCPLLGKRHKASAEGQLILEKQWAETPVPSPYQLIVQDINCYDASEIVMQSVEDAFPAGSHVFLMSLEKPKNASTNQNELLYGWEAVVKCVNEKNRIVVQAFKYIEPNLAHIVLNQDKTSMFWYPGYQAARRLSVSSHFLSRITGSVYMGEQKNEQESQEDVNVQPRKINVGLNLKFNKRNEEVADYTKRDEEGGWLYSKKVIHILDVYYEKFPEIIDYMHEVTTSNDVYYAEEVFGKELASQKMRELEKWLQELDCRKASRQQCGSDNLDENVIREIESCLEGRNNAAKECKSKPCNLAVKASTLYRPCLNTGGTVPDSGVDYQLFDRVVNVRDGFTVPLGFRGTVVGIHPGKTETDLRLDIIFDMEFMGATKLRGSRHAGYRLPSSALINISYGRRVMDKCTTDVKTVAMDSQLRQKHRSDQRVFNERRSVPVVHPLPIHPLPVHPLPVHPLPVHPLPVYGQPPPRVMSENWRQTNSVMSGNWRQTPRQGLLPTPTTPPPPPIRLMQRSEQHNWREENQKKESRKAAGFDGGQRSILNALFPAQRNEVEAVSSVSETTDCLKSLLKIGETCDNAGGSISNGPFDKLMHDLVQVSHAKGVVVNPKIITRTILGHQVVCDIEISGRTMTSLPCPNETSARINVLQKALDDLSNPNGFLLLRNRHDSYEMDYNSRGQWGGRSEVPSFDSFATRGGSHPSREEQRKKDIIQFVPLQVVKKQTNPTFNRMRERKEEEGDVNGDTGKEATASRPLPIHKNVQQVKSDNLNSSLDSNTSSGSSTSSRKPRQRLAMKFSPSS